MIDIFNDNKGPWRNSFLKESDGTRLIGDEGFDPWSEKAKTGQFDSVDFEVRQLLGIIMAKSNELEKAVMKAFEDLRV